MALVATAITAKGADVPTVFDSYTVNNTVESTLTFDPTGTGEHLPACWGLDTAWDHNDNFVRGMRAMTPDVVDIVRVSFNPYALVTNPGVVPSGECDRQLKSRMGKVAKVEALRTGGKKVDIAINLDAGRGDLQGDYYEMNSDGSYNLDKGTKNHDEWAKLLHAYVKTIERDYGNTVVSVAPFNEPDYWWNNLRQPHFMAINKALRSKYPDLQGVRISGGNTLNCDEAHAWYDYLKEDLDEGNTHQLAGDFNHYASFFEKVCNDGKYATGDELHNVMEAMVGIEYGMQTGIWWGEAARVRGQFCQASNLGTRLAYGENRYAWSAASVYKRSENRSQAFLGVSERQGRPASYSFVSSTRPVYVEGAGPAYEFVLSVPGDANGTYQGAGQRNAEAVYDIAWGDDVQPEINGQYYIIAKANGRALQAPSSLTSTSIMGANYSTTQARIKWDVKKVNVDNGGDYSYYQITDAANPTYGFNLQAWGLNEEYDPSDRYYSVPVIRSSIIARDDNSGREYTADNCLWYLEYAGNGWFRIRSKVSDYVVRPKKSTNGTISNTASLVQAPYDAADDNQLFRFIPVDNAPASFETEAPAAPQGVTATAGNATITVSWNAVNDAELASYSLLRSDDGGAYNTIARNLKDTKIIDNTVQASHSYTYKIVAYDKAGNRSDASAEASASLQAYASLWCSLDFDDTLEDATGNGFHARASTDAAFVEGKHGNSLRPNPNETVMLPLGAAPIGARFTVAAWVKTRSTSTPGQYLFDFGTDENNHVGLSVNNGSGKMRMHAVTNLGAGTEIELTAASPSASDWHHVAATFDLQEWHLYLDGVEVGKLEMADMQGYVPRNKVLNYVGRSMRQFTYNGNNGSKSSTQALNNIDDFHIYNFPLSPDQVIMDMNGETVGVETLEATGAEVVSREYFNLKGMLIGQPAQGETVIVRTRYSDGTVTSTKEVVK